MGSNTLQTEEINTVCAEMAAHSKMQAWHLIKNDSSEVQHDTHHTAISRNLQRTDIWEAASADVNAENTELEMILVVWLTQILVARK